MRSDVSAEHPLVNMQLGFYLCVERQWGAGRGSRRYWQGRKDHFQKFHLTAAALARYRRSSQPSAKTYFLLDVIEAESERTTAHNGDVHTADALEGTITRFKRPEKG